MNGAPMKLEEIKALAQELVANYRTLDTRPEWLRAVPYSVDESLGVYQLFLYVLLSRHPEFARCLEIGTHLGTSSLQIAEAGASVITIDIDAKYTILTQGIAAEHGLNNRLTALTGDSSTIAVDGPFDLLFIDGDHTLEQAHSDYLRFRPLVREGGLMLFDDTQFNDGMKTAWANVTDPKIELVELHHMGFGIAIKDSSAPQPKSLNEIKEPQ